ncbi:MAG: PcfJ domain-containing protein [Verrucomicrobia bacterium]|nr:PcfJ domain-containing protein [Cytophagales bacterium]
MGKIKTIPKYLQQKLDYQQENELALQKSLKESRKFEKSFRQTVEGIFAGKFKKHHFSTTIYETIHTCYEKVSATKNQTKALAFKNLLLQIDKAGCKKLLEEPDFVKGIFNISQKSHAYLRDLSAWKPKSYNVEKQFSSLVRYLFAKYEMALFWDSAWFSDHDYERNWFIEIANGTPARVIVNQVELTKKMAHAFLHAPDYCNVSEALRYAQTLGYGGDAYLAWFINRSRLGRNNFREEAFWATVIRFFAEAGMFDAQHLETMVDYLHEQRLQNPTFTMKGRTIAAVLRQTLAWHDDLNRTHNRGGLYVWKSSGLAGFEWEEGKDLMLKTYRIRELLSSNELHDEGKIMNHCVASYAWACNKGNTAIFSLALDNFGFTERLITIEVNLKTNQIVQAKGKYNRQMNGKESQLINKWANQEDLKFSKWL